MTKKKYGLARAKKAWHSSVVTLGGTFAASLVASGKLGTETVAASAGMAVTAAILAFVATYRAENAL